MTNEALTISVSTGLLKNSTLSGLVPLAATTAGVTTITTSDTDAEIVCAGAATNITMSIRGKGAGGGRIVSSNGKCSLAAINGDLAATCGNADDTAILGFDLTPLAFVIFDEVDPDTPLLHMDNTSATFRDTVTASGGIIFPTSAGDVPSGAWYDNAGTLTKKP